MSLLKSEDPENVKSRKISVGCGTIHVGNNVSIETIQEIAEANNITPDKIRFYADDSYISFYYEREETPEEYRYRLDEIEKADVRKFVDILASFNVYCLIKSKIKTLFLLHFTGEGNTRLADWQEKIVRNFFGEKTTAELIEEGYQKGLVEGQKKYNELCAIMQKTLTGQKTS